jgi:hypothetical protein
VGLGELMGLTRGKNRAKTPEKTATSSVKTGKSLPLGHKNRSVFGPSWVHQLAYTHRISEGHSGRLATPPSGPRWGSSLRHFDPNFFVWENFLSPGFATKTAAMTIGIVHGILSFSRRV